MFILALLDLLMSFNTIDHGTLLGQLRELGVGSTVLCWFTSPLWDLWQLLVIGEERICYVKCQGVWCPPSFYSTSKLHEIVGLTYHCHGVCISTLEN